MSFVPTTSASPSPAPTATATPSWCDDGKVEGYHASLRLLRWRRLRVTLRNVRNDYAREHPFFVCKALLKSAASQAGLAGKVDFLWRPSSAPLPHRVRKGHLYALDLVFPGAGQEDVAAFAGGLRTWAADGRHNFTLERLGEPEERGLGILEAEMLGALDTTAGEVCLDFLSPLAFKSSDSRRPHVLEAQALIDFCTVHLARLFPEQMLPAGIEAGRLETLPWFWEEVGLGGSPIRHKSKSQPGHVHLCGYVGPLYLRGEWQRHLPVLLACSELHAGFGRGAKDLRTNSPDKREALSHGHGGFILKTGRPCLDRVLSDPNRFHATRRELAGESPVAQELHALLDDGESLAAEVHGAFQAGTYAPEPACFCDLPKKDGGTRRIGLIGARDRILQGTLLQVLAAPLDRALMEAAIGYRPGRSVAFAARKVREAAAEGFTHAVRCDIRDFFDSIDWELMDRAIDAALPMADRLLRACLKSVYRAPIRLDAERVRPRDRGLPQGSPLSPLLANLYLTPLDATLEAQGQRALRFGDDLLVLTRGSGPAETILDALSRKLADLRLELHPDKTSIQPLDEGFRFLGVDFPAALDEEEVAPEPLHKSLHVQEPYAFAGLDGRSVVIRKNREILARVPLERVGEVVFYGDGAASHRLLQTCSQEKIPVSFCSRTGWHLCTLRPDSRLWFERLARHHRRYEDLGEAGRLRVARAVVAAKLHNYACWLGSLPGEASRECRGFIAATLDRLDGAETVEALRGHEGAAAARIYPCLNGRLTNLDFRSNGRAPRAKPDRYNALLDFFYSRLFTRINVLLRDAGVNPYLGFLHSGKDNYESLVCDLQEPFRARMDRLVHKLVRQRTVRPEDIASDEGGPWRPASGAVVGKLLEAFSREESVRLAGDPATLGENLRAQCGAIRRWVDGQEGDVRFYRAK